jgi:outer membrane protein assembly factor BamB
MKNHHGGMVIVGDFLYGCSDPGFLICLDVDSGQEKWRSRNPGKGSIAYADGYLIVRNEKGPVTLVAANPERYEQIAQFETPQNLRSQRPQWAYPVVADGKLFLRDQDVLLVYDLSK